MIFFFMGVGVVVVQTIFPYFFIHLKSKFVFGGTHKIFLSKLLRIFQKLEWLVSSDQRTLIFAPFLCIFITLFFSILLEELYFQTGKSNLTDEWKIRKLFYRKAILC